MRALDRSIVAPIRCDVANSSRTCRSDVANSSRARRSDVANSSRARRSDVANSSRAHRNDVANSSRARPSQAMPLSATIDWFVSGQLFSYILLTEYCPESRATKKRQRQTANGAEWRKSATFSLGSAARGRGRTSTAG